MPSWPLEHKGRSSLAVPISPLYHIIALPQAGPAPRHNERWRGLGLPATCSGCCIIWDTGINPYISLFHLPPIKGNPCQSGDTAHVEHPAPPQTPLGRTRGFLWGPARFIRFYARIKWFVKVPRWGVVIKSGELDTGCCGAAFVCNSSAGSGASLCNHSWGLDVLSKQGTAWRGAHELGSASG